MIPDIRDGDYKRPQTIDDAYLRVEVLIEQLLVEMQHVGDCADDDIQAQEESPLVRKCVEIYDRLGERSMIHEWLAVDAVTHAVYELMRINLSEYTDVDKITAHNRYQLKMLINEDRGECLEQEQRREL